MFTIKHYPWSSSLCHPVAVFTLVCFICTLFLQHDAVFARQKKDREPNGILNLTTDYEGLEIKIDGKQIGETPLPLYELSSGFHRIRVFHPDHGSWLSQDWIRSLEIKPDDTLNVRIVFEWHYMVNSVPYGSRVFVNGNEQGETPFYLKICGDESKKVTLLSPGYSDSTIVITNQVNQLINIKLQRQPERLATLNTDFLEPGKSKNSTSYLWAFVGTTLAAGAAALYFREKADNSYERYLKTANPQGFSKHYDDARKFDKYAAVSFATFQVSFVASFYLFLKRVNK